MREERQRYLVPRQVVARAEVMSGLGIAELGVIIAGLAAALGVQWAVGLVLGVVLPRGAVVLARVFCAVVVAGAGWIATRPAQGGRVMDYVAAMVRHWRRGEAPVLYGPGSGGAG